MMKAKALVFGLSAMILSGIALAEDEGAVDRPLAPGATYGTIKFQGSINDVPCSIDEANKNQVVKFGDIALHELTSNKFRSDSENFDIVLKNCSTETYKNAQITFSGATVSGIKGFTGDLLGLGGKVENAGIAITDRAGTKIVFGQSFPAKGSEYTLNNGDGIETKLSFSAYVKGSEDTAKKATTGNFDTVANFKINYL